MGNEDLLLSVGRYQGRRKVLQLVVAEQGENESIAQKYLNASEDLIQ